MQHRGAIERVAHECAVDLAADGVVYAEIRMAPELCTEAGLSLDEAVEAMLAGFRRRRGHGPDDLPHPVCDAHGGAVANRRTRCALARRGRRRVRHRQRRKASADSSPRRLRLRASARTSTTIHAGEAFGLPSIWEAVQFCGAERLGTG
jgi:adenosine deaminase